MKRNFLKYLALGLVLLTLIAAGACAKTETTTPPPSTPPPAAFEITSLDVTPLQVTAGETVTITAVVGNTGGSEGTYAAVLTVDEATVETKQVTLAAGASQTVTFSLVKNTPGTYQIGIGGLSSSLTVKPKLVAIEVRLKYDDGTSDGTASAGGYAFRVHFSPPATPFTITGITVFTNLYGSGYEEQKTEVDILGQDLTLLFSFQKPATEFSLSPGWVTIEVPSIIVNSDFYVDFCTNSRSYGGVNIHYDSSTTNEHSEFIILSSGKATWLWKFPKDTTNWMIRVVGTYMAPESQ
jgi:hypothetical protein